MLTVGEEQQHTTLAASINRSGSAVNEAEGSKHMEKMFFVDGAFRSDHDGDESGFVDEHARFKSEE